MANNDWRKKFQYDPKRNDPFRISRSKIDLFTQCPRCFYLDVRLGVKRPSMPGFTLNIAVDELLKKEFDTHRKAKTPHPYMENEGLDAVPYDSPDLDAWRDSLKRGIQFHHKPTNLIIRGGIDDIWIDSNGDVIIVDYKATSKKDEPTIEGGWGDQYKRQMEIYQWLFKKNDFSVSPIGYFVYCNGRKNEDGFSNRLNFDIYMIPYSGNTDWVEGIITELHSALQGDLPLANPDCEHCNYRVRAYSHEEETPKESKRKTSEQNTLF